MTSIAEERTKLAAVGWRLRRREEWGSRFNYTNARAVTEPATRVFVHITITNPSAYSSDDAHARAVEAIGISRFPATGISYNRLLFQSGAAYEGQPIGRRGAHTVNDKKLASCITSGCPGRGAPLTAPDWNLNVNSRAYVICQNVDDTVTDKQLDSVAKCIAADKLAGFVVRTAEIHGHRCVSAKSCPGDRMWARMGELEQKINHYLQVGVGDPPPPPPPTPAREAPDMILANEAGSDRVWLLSGLLRRHVASLATMNELVAAGVPHASRSESEVPVRVLQSFVEGPPVTDDIAAPGVALAGLTGLELAVVREADTQSIWLVSGSTRRQVMSLSALNALRTAGVAWDSKAAGLTGWQLEAFTELSPVTDVESPTP